MCKHGVRTMQAEILRGHCMSVLDRIPVSAHCNVVEGLAASSCIPYFSCLHNILKHDSSNHQTAHGDV